MFFKLYFYCLHYYRCSYLPPTTPLPASTQPPPPFPLAFPHCCLCLWVMYIYVLWLNTSPSFTQSSPHLSPVSCQSVPSMPVSILSVYFVHWIPHKSEVIWYLFFTNWLISFSTIISRPNHAVTKGKSSFFIMAV